MQFLIDFVSRKGRLCSDPFLPTWPRKRKEKDNPDLTGDGAVESMNKQLEVPALGF